MAVCLENALKCLEALESIVLQSFGPNGLDIAMKTETGCILVTNSGQIMLDSVSLSHQSGRLILNQVSKHTNITGDNSKMFIIILTEFLRSIYQENLLRSKAGNITSLLSGLSSACAKLNKRVQEEFYLPLRKYCQQITANESSLAQFERCIRGMAKTSLQGRFCPQVVDVLVEQITQLVIHHKSEKSQWLSYITHLIEEFPDTCIQIFGLGISKSCVKKGFILQREPSGRCEKEFFDGRVQFICINHCFDFEKVEFAKVNFAFDELKMKRCTQIRAEMLHKFSNKLQDNGIKILLCKAKLPDYAMPILGSKFCILQNICEEDLQRLCSFFKILPTENLEDIFEEDITMYVGNLSSAGSVIIGTLKFFNLVPEKQCQNSRPCSQLILCAPSSGICQQYYKEILNVLKVIKMAFYDQYGYETYQDQLFYLPGAGASEFFISNHLDAMTIKSDDEYLKLAACSLSKALLSIPKNLHKNSNKSGENAKFVKVLCALNQMQSDKTNPSCHLYGIDGYTGAIINPIESNIIEPFSSKILLIDHILQAAQQIFKIDHIIPSKTMNQKSSIS